MPELNKDYWENRYQAEDTGWDLGAPSTPLKEYFDQLTDHALRILIPGAGNAWEAEYLWHQGFRHTYVLDFAPEALQRFHKRVPGFPQEQLVAADFFDYNPAEKFDLVVEQTFFCAIDPKLREAYVQQMLRLLKPGGKIAGLLFNDVLNTDKPPFGGNPEVYRPLFEPYFILKQFETAHNSIAPRAGRELFIQFIKK